MEEICTLEKLAEQALRIINGGDVNYEEDLDSRDIQLYITQALGALVRRGFFETKNDLIGEVNGNLVLTFPNVAVQKDSAGFFAKLPSCTVGLMEGRGIHEVGDSGGTYIPSMNGWANSFTSLDSLRLQGQVGYYPENNTVRFFNVKDFDGHRVYLKLVAAYDAIQEDQEIAIPMDMQLEIVSQTVQLFSQTPSEDKVSDNVDDEIKT